MKQTEPVRLSPSFREKVWGTTEIEPWFPRSQSKIGEVWFEADLPLLVKFVFTSERLSVQVHPDDEFAAAHEKSRGKTERWYVLRADPGARIGLLTLAIVSGCRVVITDDPCGSRRVADVLTAVLSAS